MPFTKDGRWVPYIIDDEEEKKKISYGQPPRFEGDDEKPSHDPENRRTRIDYGAPPRFDGGKKERATTEEVFGPPEPPKKREVFGPPEPTDNREVFGPPEPPKETIGTKARKFFLPTQEEIKERGTTLYELLERPLDSITDALTFGGFNKVTDKLGWEKPYKEEPENFAEQAADKIGETLSYGLGGGAARQVGRQIATGPIGRNIAQRGKEILGRNPLPRPNPQTGGSLSQELAGLGAGAAAFGGAQSFAEGWTDTELEEKNAMQEIAGNMRYGFYQNVRNIGSFAEMVGKDEVGDSIKGFADRQGEKFGSKYSKEFSWKSFLDPEYYRTTIAQSLPSIIMTMPLSVVGYGGAALAAGKIGLGSFGRTVAGSVGGTALSAPLESAMIAGGTFEEALKRGNSEEEAEKIGQKAFWNTLAVTAVTQAPELAAMFAPVRRLIPSIQNQLADISIRAGIAGTSEGIQEVAQEWAVSDALGEEFKLSEQGESFGLGFLFGGAMGGASAFANPGTDDTTTSVNAPNVLPGDKSIIDPNNPIRSIQSRAKEIMSDAMRADFETEIETLRSQGLADDAAEVNAWEALAMTEEGKELIDRATKEVLEEKARGEVTQPTETDASAASTEGPIQTVRQVNELPVQAGPQPYQRPMFDVPMQTVRQISDTPMQTARQVSETPMQTVRQISELPGQAGPQERQVQTNDMITVADRDGQFTVTDLRGNDKKLKAVDENGKTFYFNKSKVSPVILPTVDDLVPGDPITVEGREGTFTVDDLRGNDKRLRALDENGKTYHFNKSKVQPVQRPEVPTDTEIVVRQSDVQDTSTVRQDDVQSTSDVRQDDVQETSVSTMSEQAFTAFVNDLRQRRDNLSPEALQSTLDRLDNVARTNNYEIPSDLRLESEQASESDQAIMRLLQENPNMSNDEIQDELVWQEISVSDLQIDTIRNRMQPDQTETDSEQEYMDARNRQKLEDQWQDMKKDIAGLGRLSYANQIERLEEAIAFAETNGFDVPGHWSGALEAARLNLEKENKEKEEEKAKKRETKEQLKKLEQEKEEERRKYDEEIHPKDRHIYNELMNYQRYRSLEPKSKKDVINKIRQMSYSTNKNLVVTLEDTADQWDVYNAFDDETSAESKQRLLKTYTDRYTEDNFDAILMENSFIKFSPGEQAETNDDGTYINSGAMTVTLNEEKKNRIEVDFKIDVPEVIEQKLTEFKFKYGKRLNIHYAANTQPRKTMLYTINNYLNTPLNKGTANALRQEVQEYWDNENSYVEPGTRIPGTLYFYKNKYLIEDSFMDGMTPDGKRKRNEFSSIAGKNRYKQTLKIEDTPLEQIINLGDVKGNSLEDGLAFIDRLETELVPYEPPAATETTTEETAAPSFNEGDRVRFTSNGKELTGSIRSIDTERNTATVDVDQITRAGGVPIGRLETVNLNNLEHEEPVTQTPEQPITENESTEIQVTGDTTTVSTPRGTSLDVQYAIVELSDLIASHNPNGTANPDYPSELQPRDRSRQAQVIEINRIAGTLNPELLGANPLATDGAPIISSDLIVESGNGRTLALNQVYNDNEYNQQRLRYLNWMVNNVEKFGIDKENLETFQNPVLVRVRRSDIDREAFVAEANDSTVSSMSATEQALSDARRISGTLMNLFAPNDTGEINTAPNRDFITGFMNDVVAPTERNRLITENGYLSQDGLNRVRNAIFARAYGDPGAIAALAEATDNNVKSIMNQLVIAASRVAFAQDNIESGSFYDLGINSNIVETLNTISDLRREGTKVETFLNQLSLFEEMSPFSKDMLRFFDEYGSGKTGKPVKTIGATILEYYRGLERLGDPNQESLFGDSEPPAREQLFDISIKKVIGDETLQTTLFNSEEEQNLFDDGPNPNQDEPGDQEGSTTETATEEEPPTITFSEGDRVYHKGEGTGTIRELSSDGATAYVHFDSFEEGRTRSYDVTDLTPSDTPAPATSRPPRPPKEQPNKYDNARSTSSRAADAARRRLAKRHNGNVTLRAGLPFDDLIDFAIIGWDKLNQKMMDRAEFAEEMVKEFGDGVRKWMGAIYGQSVDMIEMSEEEIEELLREAYNDDSMTLYDDGGETDGAEQAGTDGEGTLEETPSDDVPGTSSDRDAEQGAGESTGTNDGSNVSDTDGPGAQEPNTGGTERGAEGGPPVQSEESSVGDSTGDVDSSSGRGNRAGTRKPSKGERVNTSHHRVDFQITDELNNLGGPKTRFKNNMEAINTLVTIESEGRLANSEEQKVLAKYIGWGGIAQAFDPDNNQWKKEYEQLKSLVDDNLITKSDYEEARSSSQTAFFTSPIVIDGMYNALRRLGYQGGGRVLEPSVGTGNFFGLMPSDLMKGTERIATEKDSLTARMAKQLYQKSKIYNLPFEKLKESNGYFDLAIGNVPFGNIKIVDTKYKGKLAFVKQRIHNYFFVKSLDKVRDGGIVAFVTSSGTMNSVTGKNVRELLGERADFLGAIRLPGNAFKENANTEVTSDIIFLQKRPEGQRANHVANFFSTSNITVKNRDGENVEVPQNEYFLNNPDMELGERTVDKLTGKRLGITADGRHLEKAIKEAITRLPENIYTNRQIEIEPDEIADDAFYDMNELTEGSIGLQEGKLVQKVNGEVVKYTAKDKKTEDRIKGMLPVRDAARNVLQLQKTGTDDQTLKAAQKQLNELYDKYVKKFGYLNDQANRRAITDDSVGSSLLASLEKVKESGKGKNKKVTITKEAIFTERTINATTQITSVETAEEALVVSLFENGQINLEKMSQLSNKTEAEIVEELKGRIYKDPETETWITADEYLSGNVRQKLRQAQEVARDDSTYKNNVEALKEVQPEDLTPNQITVRLGAPWVSANDMQDFINELLDTQDKVEVKYVPQTAQWFIREKDKFRSSLDSNARNYSEYGVRNRNGKDATAIKIIEDALNLRLTTVTYKDIETDRVMVDINLTNEARQKQKEIQEVFSDWLWEDEARQERLLTEYNERFNSVRLREYDGSIVYGDDVNYRKIPGMSEKYKLHSHQKDAVWRTLQGGNTLLAHVVGAGKTLEMIVAGMEMKRLGFVSKPTYVVPNHLLDQWESDFRDAYPGANILKIGNDDIPSVTVQRSDIAEDFKSKKQLAPGVKVSLKGQGNKRYTVGFDSNNQKFALIDSKDNKITGKASDIAKVYRPMTDAEYEARKKERQAERGAALNKIAVGNYDAILITHQTFQKLPVSPETTQAHIREQLQELEIALRALYQDGEAKGSRSVKALEKAKQNLESQILENLDEESRNVAIPFEELGIDQIFVDESHMFKNLKFHTKMHNVSGLPQTNSKRAQDMYLKTQWLSQTRNGKGVVFASGTPISNTLAEMYTLQRYLGMNDLRANGLGHFDSWSALFGESVTGIEMDATGKFKQKTRFARFHNLQELMTMYKSFADIKTADMLKLDTPDNVNYETVVAPMSDWQREYLRELQGRAELIRDRRVTPEEDNFLKLTSDGRKMALDIRLVNPDAPDFAESKLNKAVENIVKIYKDKEIAKDREGNTVDNHTQVVFLDMGTPRKKKEKDGEEVDETTENEGVSTYQEIYNKLVQQGIPKNEIAFIHDANTDKKKKVLFNDVNEGRVRILLGSTEKMGAGMNVQTRLVALHHLDAPWRPSDVEQREGRIIRQGNKNNSVNVYSYTTEGSFDAIMWDGIRRKATFIQQVMNGSADVRSLEDVEALVLGYAQIAAQASGNPLWMEQAELQKEMMELTSAKTGHEHRLREAKKYIREAPGQIKVYEGNVADLEADHARKQDMSGENFRLDLDGKTYLKRAEAGEALMAYMEDPNLTSDLADGETKQIGEYAGFPLFYTKGKVVAFSLRGNRTYEFSGNPESALGTVSRMDNQIAHLDEYAKNSDERIKQIKKNLKTYEKTAKSKFKQQDQLNEVSQRLREIQQEIMELDGDDRASGGEAEGYSGTDNVDTFVEPIDMGATQNEQATGEENRRWRGKIFDQEDTETTETRTVKRADILAYISQAFRVPIGTGGYRGRAKAIYKKQENIILTKQFADFVAITHELGHQLDTKYNFSLKLKDLLETEVESELLGELYDLAINNLNPDIINDTVPMATIRREGFAEFMRLYFDNPRRLHEETPQFYEYFLRRMKNEDFEFKKNVQNKFKNMEGLAESFKESSTMLDNIDIAAELLDIWRDQDPADRIDGVIDTRADRGLTLENLSTFVKEKYTMGTREFYNSLFEELAPLDRAVKELTGQKLEKRTLPGNKDPFVLAWNNRGVSGKIRTFIDFGVVDDNGQKVGSSLREILETVPNIKELNRYLVARHAKDLIQNHGKVNTPVEIRDANKTIRNTPEEYVTAAEKLYEFQEAVTNELVKGGLLDTKQVDDWKLQYPYYVPFYRVMEDSGTRDGSNISSSPGKRFANQRNPVKRMKEKGSARNVIDPIESVIKNTYMYLQIAERNQVGVALADLVDKTPDSAWLMQKIDTPQYAAKFSINEIQRSLEAANIDMEYADMDQVAAIFRPIFMPKASEQELTVYREGQPVFYKVHDKDLYKGLLALERDTMNWIIKFLSGPNQLLRQTITATPDFIGRQLFRTLGTTMMQTQSYQKWGGLEAIKMPFHAVGNLIELISTRKQSAKYYEWLSGGGAASTLQELDRDYLGESSKSLLKMQEKGHKAIRIKTLMNPMEHLRAINQVGQTLDEAFRLAEYQQAYRETGDRAKAIQRSRDVDYDPSRAGKYGRNINRLLLFFNPAIQGLEKTYRVAIKEQPIQTLIRGTIFLTLPTLALLMTNWDDEEYWELPVWRRDGFWNIKIGGRFISIPMPFEWGLMFKVLPERLITNYLQATNTEISDPWFEFTKTVESVVVPEWIPTIIAPIVEWKTNQSLSFGNPVVPMSKEGLEPELQYNSQTSEVAKLIGAGLNLSPMKLDALYKGYTGTVGQVPLKAADKGLLFFGIGDKEAAVPDNQRNFWEQTFKGFLPKADQGSTTSINIFYDELQKLESEQKSFGEPGYVKPELRLYRSVSADMADMRAMREWIVLENQTLTSEEKAQWVKDTDRAIIDYSRIMLGKEARYQETDAKVFEAMTWFKEAKQEVMNQNRKRAKRDFDYKN